MTHPRNIEVVIDEIIDHIDYVLARTQDRSIVEFRADRDLWQSIERSLEIISEASRRLPDELKSVRPDIPWRQVADVGNVLRHSYFAVKVDIVWAIISEDLEPLRDALVQSARELNAVNGSRVMRGGQRSFMGLAFSASMRSRMAWCSAQIASA